MYSVLMMAAFAASPMEADCLLAGMAARREARISARQERRGASASAAGCDGSSAATFNYNPASFAVAASSGCTGGQSLQYAPAGYQPGAATYTPSPQPTTFYYVPASAPQTQSGPLFFPNRPTFFLRNQQCIPGVNCFP